LDISLSFGAAMTLGYGSLKSSQFADDLGTIFAAIQHRLSFPFPYWKIFGNSPKETRVRKTLEKMVNAEIALIKKNPAEFNTTTLSFLVDSGLSNEEIVSNTLQIFVASYHSTGLTIMWCFYYLSLYPQFQERLRNETRKFGDSKEWTYANILEMTELQNFVKEVLRINPTSPMIFLENPEPLKIGDKIIPPNTLILAHGHHAQNRVFENPKEFDPDRFNNLTEEQKSFASMNFGGGNRLCLGKNLAEVELFTVIAVLCYTHKISFTNGDPNNAGRGPTLSKFAREPAATFSFAFEKV